MIYKGLYEKKKKIGGPLGVRSIGTRHFLRDSNQHKMEMLRVENPQNDRPTNCFILFHHLVFL